MSVPILCHFVVAVVADIRNRQALVQCMQQKILQCPDSPRVLAQYDLDLTSFERGLDMLCDNIGGWTF